jgi:hypothetical protein
MLKKRLHYLQGFYSRENQGVFPFIFGHDYRPDMPEEEVEYINKATVVQMEERSK